MMHAHDLSLTPLPRRALLAQPGGTGRAVGVFSGSVWITEEGELADHVLGPGDSLVLRRPGLALVEGLHDSQLILFETTAPDAWAQALRLAPPPVVQAGGAAGASQGEPARTLAPTVADYERVARELRRQAIAEVAGRLWRALTGWLRRQVAARPTPAPGRRPPRAAGGPAPAWHAPR